jgi:hypothetical protein
VYECPDCDSTWDCEEIPDDAYADEDYSDDDY